MFFFLVFLVVYPLIDMPYFLEFAILICNLINYNEFYTLLPPNPLKITLNVQQHLLLVQLLFAGYLLI